MSKQTYHSDVELLELILKELQSISKSLAETTTALSPSSGGKGGVAGLPGGGIGFIDNFKLQRMLNISDRTAIEWRKKGTLKYTRIHGKIYYKLSDVELMLRKHYGRGEAGGKEGKGDNG